MANEESISTVFKALCDENRIQILKRLIHGERCACELQGDVAIGQSTLSHHMKILCNSGIVIPRREGRWMHYRISTEGLAKAIAFLHTLQAEPENAPVQSTTGRCVCDCKAK